MPHSPFVPVGGTDSMLEYRQDGVTSKTSRTFYRGESANRFPTDRSLAADDAISTYMAKGLMPAAPMIGSNTITVAFGSCFARYLADHLNHIGYFVATRRDTTAYISNMGDGIVHTYALRQQFEWAWENRVPQVELWHGYRGEEFGYDEEVRLKTKEIFDSAEVFVITLGLSEIWYDEPTGETFWRAVPTDKIDPTRHKFRIATQSENAANLEAIRRLIRQHRPQATIVFTLSPIPLTATFRDIPCIVANSVSKANLRSALDSFMADHRDDDALFYFPSYEISRDCFDRPFAGDRRHPHMHVVAFNVALFERYYCQSGMGDDDLLKKWREARDTDRALLSKSSEEAHAFFKASTDEIRERIREERRQARREERRQAGIGAQPADLPEPPSRDHEGAPLPESSEKGHTAFKPSADEIRKRIRDERRAARKEARRQARIEARRAGLPEPAGLAKTR